MGIHSGFDALNDIDMKSNKIKSDTLTESTSNAGVTADGVLLKDGVVIEQDNLKTNNLTNASVKGGSFPIIPTTVQGTVYTSASQWIESDKYRLYISSGTSAFSVNFDKVVGATTNPVLKIAGTDGTGKATVSTAPFVTTTTADLVGRYGIPVRSSVSYRLNTLFRTIATLPSNTFNISILQFDINGTLIGTLNTSSNYGGSVLDWTNVIQSFTTASNAAYIVVQYNLSVAGIQAVYIDINKSRLVQLSTTTVAVNTATPVEYIIQAKSRRDMIDQSRDVTASFANTYTAPINIDEGVTHRLTFTPTSKYLSTIKFYVTDKGTGNATVVIHDANNVQVIGSTSVTNYIPNANLVVNAWNEFKIPGIRTSGVYHAHLLSSTGDLKVKTQTASDLETASFIEYATAKTKSMSATLNGVETRIEDANGDGFLSDAIWNLKTGKFIYSGNFVTGATSHTDVTFINDVYNFTGGQNYYNFAWGNGLASSSATQGYIFKVNTVFPLKKMVLQIQTVIAATRSYKIQYSTDNISYKDLQTFDNSDDSQFRYVELPANEIKDQTVVYLKMLGVSSTAYMKQLTILADLDITKVPIGTVYDINKTNKFVNTIQGASNISRIYYRLNKYSNDFGIIMPALEFTDSSGVVIRSVMLLPIDNSQETNPAVHILNTESTNVNGVNGGTGSNSSTGVILNDGEYLILTASPNVITIAYEIGSGTTSFTYISKNVLYLSANRGVVSSVLSNSEANIVHSVKQMSLTSIVEDLLTRINTIQEKKVLGYSTADVPYVTFGKENAQYVYKPNSPTEGYGFRDVLTSGVNEIYIKEGEYDMTNQFDVSVIKSNTYLHGTGTKTILKNNIVIDSDISTPGILRLDPGTKNVRISNLMLKGNFDNILHGDGAGFGIKVLGRPDSICENIIVDHVYSEVFAISYWFQSVKSLKVHNCISMNGERSMLFADCKDVSIMGHTGKTGISTADVGSNDPWMKRGIYIYGSEDVNLSNIVIKNAFGTGIFIRTDDTYIFQVDGGVKYLTNQRNVNLNNVIVDNRELEGSSYGDMRYGALFIGAGTTPGHENIRVNNSQFLNNEGCAFSIFRNSGLGPAPIKDIRINHCLFSNLKYVTNYPVFGVYTIDGRTEPDDWAVNGLEISNSAFEGPYPFRGWRIQNLRVKNTRFVVPVSGDLYNLDALYLKNCQNIEFINCDFDAHTAGTGKDVNLDIGITGTVRFVNCRAANSRVSINASIVSGDFLNNTGFGDHNNWKDGVTSRKESLTMSSGDTFTLTTSKSGYGSIQIGTNEEFAQYRFDNTGAITLFNQSSNVVNTDTGGKFCIINSGTSIVFKNRLPASKRIKFTAEYS